ncbi:MAG: bifunctional phosphoribosylaminoimidazolecarboxamide formyltransferase/IMP cyclohydrolase [Firmicutes bacterium]|nr:bifunctional phosphoribosylaminoimidazolecarboxamide formyltransferase/IMP cyclohydrolase [Bacillota bacterium]
MKKRALLSVSDKTGIVEFAKGLVKLGYEIISTGGTAKTLLENGVQNKGISEITQFPECLDGRVKTLHPAVHAGLLAVRSDKTHMAQLDKLGLGTIDIVAVNLYPFKETVLKPDVSFAEAVENIDIGGPTMLRAAAKNYQDVAVLVDPADYAELLQRLNAGDVSVEFKKLLQYKVFAHTAVYDSLISNYLAKQLNIEFPQDLTLAFSKRQDLRYGENPHQNGAFYADALAAKSSLSQAVILQGKELSYNNINDAAGALDLLNEFSECACVAVKHANPCGAAVKKTPLDAYKAAYDADPISIFGGIAAFNRKVDKAAAEEMIKIFLEIIIAPDYDADAAEVFKQKPNLRVLKIAGLDTPVSMRGVLDAKRIYGGLLVQDKDASLFDEGQLKVVTRRAPDKTELQQLKFAFAVVKHVKSNGIAVARDFSAIGTGGGQTNRIWAAKQALERAGEKAKGAVLASDAFFPFSDCAEEAAKAGITAIIQPGGSIRDQESIDVCNKYGIAMVFVGQRHFKH